MMYSVGFAMIRRFLALISLLVLGAVAGLMAVAGGAKSVAIVPGLAILAAMILTPYSAMYAIVATTPVNVEIAGPITVSRLVILLGAVVIYVQAAKRQIAFPRLIIAPGGALAAVFFGWIVIASLANGFGGLVGRLGPFIIFAVIFFVVLNYANRIDRIGGLFVLLAAVGLLQALLVLAEAFLGFSPFGGWQEVLAADLSEGEVRVVGTSAHPIILAGFFQVAIGVLTMLLLGARGRLLQLFWIGSLAMVLMGWWLTFARSSWIGMAVMLFVGMVLASRPTRWLAVIGGVAGVILLSFFDFSPSAVIRFIESFGAISTASATAGVAPGDESLSWRTENWAAAWAIFLENPLFGSGIDASKDLMIANMPAGAIAHRFISPEVPHNMFLVILAETGLPSFVLFVALWVVAFRSVFSVMSRPAFRPFAIALAAIMAGQVATFLFNPIPREVWLTMAMAMAMARTARLYAPAVTPPPVPATGRPDEEPARPRPPEPRGPRPRSAHRSRSLKPGTTQTRSAPAPAGPAGPAMPLPPD